MEKVDVYEVTAYSWECPKCGSNNLTNSDLELVCEDCHQIYEIGKIE